MARQRKLSPERKAFINSLIEHYNPKDAQDVQDMLKDLLGDTLQGMLEAEMDEKLGYSRYDYEHKETDDCRNDFAYDRQNSSDCKRMAESTIRKEVCGCFHGCNSFSCPSG